jgi:hypothetical protein
MRWKKKQETHPLHLNELGDERIVLEFAFLPTAMSNDEVTLWLEPYWSVQRFSIDMKAHFKYGKKKYKWSEIKRIEPRPFSWYP